MILPVPIASLAWQQAHDDRAHLLEVHLDVAVERRRSPSPRRAACACRAASFATTPLFGSGVLPSWLAVERDLGADEVGLDLQRAVDLLRREQPVRGDAHALDQLVGAAAQRIALDALRLAGRDVDDLDVEHVVVAERADRPGDDEVDAEPLADRGQALLLAGAVLLGGA